MKTENIQIKPIQNIKKTVIKIKNHVDIFKKKIIKMRKKTKTLK